MYQLVRLASGTHSIRSIADAETYHPGIGPASEAEVLYVRQLDLLNRVRETDGEFVIWDVGLGAGANALTAIRLIVEAAKHAFAENPVGSPKRVSIVSFDRTPAAAEFALQHSPHLDYLHGFDALLSTLVAKGSAGLSNAAFELQWNLALADFPTLLNQEDAELSTSGSVKIPAPHAIFFDPHSPTKNPTMWTVELFRNLFRHMNPDRPCLLATYTRSTMARTAMLLGGWFVGVGHASGLKEETTVAANRLELLNEPLAPRWLERIERSGGAEPLWEPVYRQAPLSAETLEKLRQHPQFKT